MACLHCFFPIKAVLVLILIEVSTSVDTDGFKCSPTWYRHSNTCFKEEPGQFLFAQARGKCEALDAHLAVVDSDQVAAGLARLISLTAYRRGWIGVTRDEETNRLMWDGVDRDVVYQREIYATDQCTAVLIGSGSIMPIDCNRNVMALAICQKNATCDPKKDDCGTELKLIEPTTTTTTTTTTQTTTSFTSTATSATPSSSTSTTTSTTERSTTTSSTTTAEQVQEVTVHDHKIIVRNFTSVEREYVYVNCSNKETKAATVDEKTDKSVVSGVAGAGGAAGVTVAAVIAYKKIQEVRSKRKVKDSASSDTSQSTV